MSRLRGGDSTNWSLFLPKDRPFNTNRNPAMLPPATKHGGTPMNESFLQLRINEIHGERLAEAAARRLAREAKAASKKDPAALTGLLDRLRRGLGFPLSRPI
jgi:hypothetical protein